MKLPKTVLLVDDDKTIRSIYSRVLKKMGVESVETAEDGEVALKKYSSLSIDVVILDIRMPHMSGFDVLRKIREINPEATVLMLSSINERKQVEDCIKIGAYDYVIKSDDISVFRDKLTNMFSKKKIYWQLSRNSPARMTAKLEDGLHKDEKVSSGDIPLFDKELDEFNKSTEHKENSPWRDTIKKVESS